MAQHFLFETTHILYFTSFSFVYTYILGNLYIFSSYNVHEREREKTLQDHFMVIFSTVSQLTIIATSFIQYHLFQSEFFFPKFDLQNIII